MELLHLEDSTNDAVLLQDLVQRELPQCNIRTVATKKDFEAALEQGGIDLIMSDYSMGGFDGLSALEIAHERHPEIPFIFVSGTIGEERAIDALRRGASDYVLKDRPARLVPAIRLALQRASDNAQHREALKRIREQAAWLDKARDAICVTDLAGRITYWNASAERVHGWSAQEAMGRQAGDLLFPGDGARWRQLADEVRQTGQWNGDLLLHDKDANTLTIESRWTLVTDNDGSRQSILMIGTDITERRKLETQVLRNQRMESIGMLAGSVAHDLNNVLTPILMGCELLESQLAETPGGQVMQSMQASARHGAALVQQLTAFARGSEGHRTPVQMASLLRDIKRILTQSLAPKIELRLNLTETPWLISADATQLNQVVINLCLNARDAMPNGGRLELRTQNLEVGPELKERVATAKPGRFLHISVTDNGTGIPPEVLSKIFEPFFTTKGIGKGTGIGLSTVANIIKTHGGFMHVESQVGAGTTFHLYFPALPDAKDGVPGKTVGEANGGRGQGVLVVDDDEAVLQMFTQLLEKAGYRVFPASDAIQGLTEYERHRSDIALVITDMVMPGMDGSTLIQALRGLQPALKIIAVTGVVSSDALKGLRCDGPPIELLRKPLKAEELFGAIERESSPMAS